MWQSPRIDYRIGFGPMRWPWGRRDILGSWRNWQTRKVEGLVPARACWFDSSRAHLNVRAVRRIEPPAVFLGNAAGGYLLRAFATPR